MIYTDFVKNCEEFLSNLSENNDKEWFNAHREEYNEKLLYPAQDFVLDMGSRLADIYPDIQAIPAVDKSIFRLYKDVRFSKDKRPFKTNLGILFWEGNKKRIECPGFYFHIEPGQFLLGSGIYMFTKELLEQFRSVVSNPAKAAQLDAIVKKIQKKNGMRIGEKSYKKIPKGFDPDYKYAEYYLYSALYSIYESNDTKKLYNADIVEYSLKVYREFFPLHEWFTENMTNN